MELERFHLNLLFGTDKNGTPSSWQLAKFGVFIFFALSGFLITYLLLLEKEKRRINIQQFYLRRILRIWPLYFFYLGIVFITYYVYNIPYPGTLPFYLFFTANVPYIIQSPLPLVTHYWSLAAEEQFYLFWPWLISWLKTNLFQWLAALIAVVIGVKLFLHFVLHIDFSQTVIDAFPFHCMMMGGAGAILYKKQNKTFLRIATHKVTQVVAWFSIGLVVLNRFHIASVLDTEIISLFTVFIIVAQITQKNRLINLEQSGFDFLGKISFGIYIYHPLVIFLLSKLIGPLTLPTISKYILTYVAVFSATIAVAFVSYNYLEHYFLKLKHRFSVLHSVPSKSETTAELRKAGG
jgi:peptidoglycan/LPS O-acetylase OafA/YrhL